MFSKIPNIPSLDTDEYNDDLELDELDKDSEISTAGFDGEEQEELDYDEEEH